MYKGISRKDSFPVTLDDDEGPVFTYYWLRPQTVRSGNKPLAAYMQAHSKKDVATIAKKTTVTDLNQWLDTVEKIENFCFHDEEDPRELIEDYEELKTVFYEHDINAFNELMNKSRNIFTLTEGEKKGSRSSSGQELSDERPTGSASTVRSASEETRGDSGLVV